MIRLLKQLDRLAKCSNFLAKIGAGSGDRTRVSSLEGLGSTAELYPPTKSTPLTSYELVDGGGFEPPKLARQIYSLIPLATREPIQHELPRAKILGTLTQERHFMGIDSLVQSFHRDFL